MTGRPWYPFYPDAYERDAGSLSYVQDSAYRRMLDHYYKSGEPLPIDKDAIYRACRAMRREERQAIDFCLGKFFFEGDDGWHQSRADEEILKAAEVSAKRAEAASKRHNKPPSKNTANGDAIAEQLDTQSTSTATPSEAKASSVKRTNTSEPPGFAEFYAAFPRKTARGAAVKAYVSALKRASAAVLLQGAIRYALERAHEDQNFTKHPATWLTQDCWLDEPVSNRPNGGRNGGHQKSAQQSAVTSISEAFSERNPDRFGDDVQRGAEVGRIAGPVDQDRTDQAPSLFGSPAADAA